MRSLLIITALWACPAAANIPAAYLACKDKAEGDACRMVGPRYGACVRDSLCVDNPDDAVDECVLCVDPCWDRDDGDPCLQTLTNEPGICATQERCTDKEETSFLECNRCVDGELETTEPKEGCAASPTTLATIPWLFILLVGAWQWRRRR